MAQRSRKKRPTAPGAVRGAGAPAVDHSTAVKTVAPKATDKARAKGKARATVKTKAKAAGAVKAAEPQDWVARYGARAELKNAEARARLVPLAEGERPWPILLAIVLTTAAALANFGAWVGGATIDGKHPGPGEMLIFAVVMLACAYGMWVLWYQAVLAFMVLLGIVIVLFFGLLLEASNPLGFIVAIAVLSGGGYLFWKLIGTLSRLQMPQPPTRR